MDLESYETYEVPIPEEFKAAMKQGARGRDNGIYGKKSDIKSNGRSVIWN